MSNVVLMMSVSLDGYIEGPHQDISWHRVDDELHQHFNDTIGQMGALLSGRVTYELMAGYWPTADADPAVTGPTAEFAGIWRDIPKVVYSRTIERAGWNTRIVRDVVPEDVRELKERAGGDVGLGGAGLAAAFLRQGLVDEFRVYVHPVLLGRGKRLFPELDTSASLRLVESRAFGNGVVLLRYERADAPGS
ncbi:dihydrofolate reductase family protein [Streptomyces sp. S.PNR 29]|uniref:dihydrofolate reductase family protein n=1 Tax=Streptomyces sp. S.PNR 29 TaxID=2973805 RepID=UPI0025AFBA48|nr:dihydrofolate reductase family protein [Streptomyces sp. S.PNR 29]MDN0195465.1 dihydrofolate reductase family protein [Streptomyces sp. S.PNR 29]